MIKILVSSDKMREELWLLLKKFLERQLPEFSKYVKEFVIKNLDTNDEEYNFGRYEIMNNRNVDFFCSGSRILLYMQ